MLMTTSIYHRIVTARLFFFGFLFKKRKKIFKYVTWTFSVKIIQYACRSLALFFIWCSKSKFNTPLSIIIIMIFFFLKRTNNYFVNFQNQQWCCHYFLFFFFFVFVSFCRFSVCLFFTVLSNLCKDQRIEDILVFMSINPSLLWPSTLVCLLKH